MKTKHMFIIGFILLALVLVIGLFTGLVGINDGQNWIYLQHLNGSVVVVDTPGMYGKWFGKTWVYSRFIEFRYNDDPDDGDKRVIWNCRVIQEIRAAKDMFLNLIKQGMMPFKVGRDGKRSSERMEEFDPVAEEVIFIPMPAVVGG